MRQLTILLVICFISLHSSSQAPLPNRYSAHEPNYFLTNFGRQDYGQVKFKVSFKYDLVIPSEDVSGKPGVKRNKLFFAYTQFAFWDIYQPSAPMRELDFTPMLYYQRNLNGVKDNVKGIKRGLEYVQVGYLHQSNGQFDSLNRSIFKLFFHASYSIKNTNESSNLKITDIWIRPQVWIWNMLADLNRDIAKYQGHGQLITTINFDYNNTAVQDVYPLILNTVVIPAAKAVSYVLNLSFNPFIRDKYTPWIPNFYGQFWSGYAESLVNYDNRFYDHRRQSVFRLGIQFRVR